MTDSPPDALERLSQLDACIVSDAAESLGLGEVVLHGLGRLAANGRLCGRAVTVQLGPADGSPSTRHLCTAAIDAAAPGDVIVVAGGRTDAGGWGGLLSQAAVRRGIEGVVVDGGVRDVDEAHELGFPVFGRRPAVRTARSRVREITSFEPVTIGEVHIEMGDWVIADGSGVVVVPADHFPDVLAAAERLARREALIVDALRSGSSATDAIGASYETMLDEPSDQS